MDKIRPKKLKYTEESIEKDIDFLKNMKFTYGSCPLQYQVHKNRKLAYYPLGWQKKESFYNKEENGVYVVTGKVSDCIVIDIDDIENPKAKAIMNFCNKNCNLI